MTAKRKWDPCIYHRGEHTDTFLKDYLADSSRHVLLIAGAGFDPRSTRVAQGLTAAAASPLSALLIREDRPDPEPALLARAEANQAKLAELVSNPDIQRIEIFAKDNAVVGGRAAARLISAVPLEGVTDVFVDVSALSIGVAFPIIKHLLASVGDQHPGLNVHVVCCDDPLVDEGIRSTPSDTTTPIHGFRGGWGLDAKSRAAILWMPLLSRGKGAIFRQIFQSLQNVQKDTVVCPILPFPASRPRMSDELIVEYAQELQVAWQVDVRDLVYAHEQSPLDLYRTILRIDDARRRVFESVGGSQIIISPLGSKALSLGALMAALDRDFTILYVESIGYSADGDALQLPPAANGGELVHIWLCGDAYGQPTATEGKAP